MAINREQPVYVDEEQQLAVKFNKKHEESEKRRIQSLLKETARKELRARRKPIFIRLKLERVEHVKVKFQGYIQVTEGT